MLEWLAFDMSVSEDFKRKVAVELDHEAQLKYTADEEAARFRQFFGV